MAWWEHTARRLNPVWRDIKDEGTLEKGEKEKGRAHVGALHLQKAWYSWVLVGVMGSSTSS